MASVYCSIRLQYTPRVRRDESEKRDKSAKKMAAASGWTCLLHSRHRQYHTRVHGRGTRIIPVQYIGPRSKIGKTDKSAKKMAAGMAWTCVLHSTHLQRGAREESEAPGPFPVVQKIIPTTTQSRQSRKQTSPRKRWRPGIPTRGLRDSRHPQQCIGTKTQIPGPFLPLQIIIPVSIPRLNIQYFRPRGTKWRMQWDHPSVDRILPLHGPTKPHHWLHPHHTARWGE